MIHGDEVIVDDGEILPHIEGCLLHVATSYDEDCVPDIRDWFEENSTIRFRNYPVDPSYLHEHDVVASNDS